MSKSVLALTCISFVLALTFICQCVLETMYLRIYITSYKIHIIH